MKAHEPELEKEIYYKTARSGGKGGQNVNKVETKVVLYFDVNNSPVLNERQKKLLHEKLKNRINEEGILKLESQSERSQILNKRKAFERFIKLLENSLKEKKKRKPTKIPKSAKEKRIDEKKKLSYKKQMREKPEL